MDELVIGEARRNVKEVEIGFPGIEADNVVHVTHAFVVVILKRGKKRCRNFSRFFVTEILREINFRKFQKYNAMFSQKFRQINLFSTNLA